MKEELVYHECQRFRQWWFIVLMVCVDSLFIFGCIFQIGFGKSFGNNPLSDLMLSMITVFMLLLSASFFFIRLDTVVNEDGVYERFFPFQLRFKFTHWDHISDASVRKINLISDMGLVRFKVLNIGNAGIRYGIGKKSYTIAGNKALKLTLINNKKIYIGTQRPDELSEFLEKLDAKRKQA